MSDHKTTKAKLPVPVTPRKPPARRKPHKPPAMQAGPVAAMVRGLIERIGDMADAIGSYEAFVTVMTITGMVGLPILQHDRCQILRLRVTAQPTAEWIRPSSARPMAGK